MVSTFYSFLDPFLGVFFKFTASEHLNSMLGVFFMAVIVSALISLVSAKVIDQKELKALREELSGYQKKMKEAQDANDEKKLKKLSKQMMEKQSAMMTMSFKPMIYNMVPILLIFGWMRGYGPLQAFSLLPYETLGKTVVVELPFALPHYGNYLGWFGWYILCSFPISTLIRKILKLEM